MAGDLEDMYTSAIKEMNAEQFTSTYNKFKWGGTSKRVAVSKSSILFESKARESIAYFNAEGKLVRLDAWLYNRGDDGEMPQKKFEAFYAKVIADLTVKFKVKPKKSGISGATRSTAYTFTLKNRSQVSLLVGFEKKPRYRADFIALVLRNYTKKDNLRGKTSQFIVKKDNSDVLIDKIPMIDQGPKGYCVPATLARIAQHYGVDISMHEIAMIADSSSGGGTSVRLALAALKKNYARVKLKIRDIRINPPGVYYIAGGAQQPISSSKAKELYDGIKDDDSKFKKFYKEIKKRIDKGQMVAWSMVVGLLPENGTPARQGGGGHMRMFIGYNEKAKELIFSDSWGRGHEVKRIDAKAAFVVTSGIYDIIP